VGMRAVPRLCIELCPGIYLTTEENHGKTSVRAGYGRSQAGAVVFIREVSRTRDWWDQW